MQNLAPDVLLMHRLADVAGDAILPHFRALDGVESKQAAVFDPVTAADRGAEAAMRTLLERERPSDGILGEEYGLAREAATRRWILDPIDGTRAFVCGLPTWGVLIALVVDGRAWIGMMAQPFVGERFWSDGERAYMARSGAVRPIATRRCPRLSEATLLATTPDMFEGDAGPRFAGLTAAVRATRYGTDCYGYAMVAAGQADVVVEAKLATYDIAAFIPIIETAGGRVTDWSGGDALAGGRVIAAGDPHIAEAVVAFLADRPG